MGNSSSGGDSGSWTNWCYIQNNTPYHVTIQDYDDNNRPLPPHSTEYNYLLKGGGWYINLVIDLPGSGKETKRLHNYEYQGITHKISDIFHLDIKRFEDQKREHEQKREEERKQREEAERKRKQEEAARKQKEEEEREQKEEAERKRKQEEAARKHKEEEERKQKEEAELKRKQEETARKQREEQERKQKEEAERKRKQEEARQREEERKQRERERERQAKIKQKEEFNEKLSKEAKLAKRFVSWNSKSKERQRETQIKSHKPRHKLCHLTLLCQTHDECEAIQHVPSMVATDSRRHGVQRHILYNTEGHKTDICDAAFTKRLVFMIFNIAPSDDLNSTWLKVARTYLLSQFVRIKGVSLAEEEQLSQFLISIEKGLSDKESLSLTKTMGKILYDSMYSKSALTPIVQKYLCLLLKFGSQFYRVHTKWMKQCFTIWVETVIPSCHKQLQNMLVDEAPLSWSPYDKLCFMQQCSELNFLVDQEKHLLHLAQSYSRPYSVMETAMKCETFKATVSKLEKDIESETQKSIETVMSEIEDTKLLDQITLDDVRDIVNKVGDKILNDKFDLKVVCKQYFSDNLPQTKRDLRTTTLDNEKLSTIVTTVVCAVKITEGYTTYVTQLVSFVVLLVSDERSVNRLLEVMTGEGKSTIIAMFAAVLCMKGKQVDIVTSSPVLASRDADHWQKFYGLFDLSCTHNQADTTEERVEIYKKDIVYGTSSAFAADILREEFEQDHVRSGRKFDVIIADEVDLLMLDQGVQFTYLSHNATVLHHMEPILASVWSIVGQFNPVLTEGGDVVYLGKPMLVTNTIAQSIGLQDPIKIFIFAEHNRFLSKSQLDGMVKANDLSSQQKLLGFENAERAIEFLVSFPFSVDAYTVTKNGQIKLTKHTTGSNDRVEKSQLTHVSDPAEGNGETEDEEKPVKILVLDGGTACLIYTREELRNCALDSVKKHMDFSETVPEDPGDDVRAKDMKLSKTKLKIPSSLEKYVSNQLPQYIESAFRCLLMEKDREYTIQLDDCGRNGKVVPVDFQNSGVIESSKRWGGGLQQMLEMKHNLSISSMSLVTNFMSHVGFFLRYKAIYGMSGTLGFEPSTHLTNEDDPDFENAFPDVVDHFFDSDSESDTTSVSDDVETVPKVELEVATQATPFIPSPTSDQLLTPCYGGDHDSDSESNTTIGSDLYTEETLHAPRGHYSTMDYLDLSAECELELESTVDSLATSNTQKVLKTIFKVQVCNIPTHLCRKLYEKPAILVQEGESRWFDEIKESIKEAIANESWKPGTGRAVLVLCEDIKTATKLKDFFAQNVEELKDKITLYAHSGNSKELKALKHKFSSGEIVIATNLAGRGTDIKITKEVNASGGLLCIVTFLPRNRRVELQAFGRTARKGKPGSVQCILDVSSLPPCYYGCGLESIRELRSKQEKIRLDELMEFDVKEVKLKEKLFQKHCTFISEVHTRIDPRNDKRVILNSLNENWGKWLEMRSEKIGQLDEVELTSELSKAHESWSPDIPSVTTDVMHLPVTNFYYLIKFGNQLVTNADKDSHEKACQYYCMSIQSDSTYSAFAYYNRAYCTIQLAKSGYMDQAIEDLESAKERLMAYTNEALVVMNCANIVLQIHQQAITPDGTMNVSDLHELKAQMETRVQVLDFVEKKIKDTIKMLNSFQESGDDAIIADSVPIFELISGCDDFTEEELYTLWNLGLEVTFTVKKKPKFRFDALAVFLLGAVEFVGGALLIAFTAGAAAEFGMTLLGEGISDMFDGAIGMVTGQFSLKEWAVYKAIGLAASLASGGISRLAGLGAKAAKFSKVVEELGEAKSIFKNATKYGEAAKESAQTAMKYAGKQVLEQGTMRLVGYLGEKAFDKIYEEIASYCKKKLMPDLLKTFTEGKLSTIVNKHFMSQLSEEYISDNEIPSVVQTNAEDFASELGIAVVDDLVRDPNIQSYLTTAGLQLFAQLSEKDKRFATAEALIGAISLVKVKASLDHLTEAFIPHMEKKGEDFVVEFEKSDHQQLQENPEASLLSCGTELKRHLAVQMGEAYKDAVTRILHNNMDVVANHGLNRTVGHFARKLVSEHVLHTEETFQHLLAGQHANYIRYAGVHERSHTEHSEESHSDHSTKQREESEHDIIAKKAEEIRKSATPGSVLELRILAEQHGKSVSVYLEKNGKVKSDYTINREATENIELVHIPPCEEYPNGHYKLRGDESDTASKDSNCLYRAFAKGMKPHLSHDELAKIAQSMREETADEVAKNPHLADLVLRRLELESLDKGDYYARLGAGKNATTRVLKGCFKEKKWGKELSVTYLQKNSVLCKARRVYSQKITAEKREQRVVYDDSRLESLDVYMKGLNFPRNIGRCQTTKPLTATVKFVINGEDVSKFFPMISYHVNPSEAGANASNETANAMITSRHYNIMERYIWKTTANGEAMRDWIGKEDFRTIANVKTGPLLPEDFDTWFDELNENRRIQSRKPISEAKKDDLRAFLEHMQSLEPRLYRVEGYTYAIKNSEGKWRTLEMPTDYDFMVPDSEQHIPTAKKLPTIEIEGVVGGHIFGKPPQYQDTSDLNPTPTQKKRFNGACSTPMPRKPQRKQVVNVLDYYNERKKRKAGKKG